MILEKGDLLLVVHRRLFESDGQRYFIGLVESYETGIARVTGHSWVREQIAGVWIQKPEPRTKILALSSGTLIVYQLPPSLSLQKLRMEIQKTDRTVLTDGDKFHMDLTENERLAITKRIR